MHNGAESKGGFSGRPDAYTAPRVTEPEPEPEPEPDPSRSPLPAPPLTGPDLTTSPVIILSDYFQDLPTVHVSVS
jgi:hypothetical protein